MVLIWLIKGVFYKIFLVYIKMSDCADLIYYQRNRDVILNRAKYFYENDKERLRVQARDKYRNLSEEEKTKRENMKKKQILQYVLRKKTKISKNLSPPKKVSV